MRMLPAAASLFAALLASLPLFAADAPLTPPGLGDPGQLQSIAMESGRLKEGLVVISGRDAGQQLVVTGTYATGQTRDLSRKVTYTVSPPDVLSVDASGWVTPLKEGEATIQAKAPEGPDTTIKCKITNLIQDLPVNFPNQVTPIFTKFGCNGGGCHGKSGGQNGFRLSLLGFEPTEDYEYLVKEGRGRRLFPAAPERSMLLSKATAQVPHGGGQRIEAGSASHKLLARWIGQGMPFGKPDDPTVTKIEIFPLERLMERNGSQQVVVVAHYSDGSTEDVTRTTQFDSNDTEMAEVTVTGLVKTGELTGSVAVMARYQGNVAVFRATVPLGIKVESTPPEKNLVDANVFAKLKALGLPPSAVCDDTTFLRRTTIDIAGRLPTAEETEAFLKDGDANKREKWIDGLLASTDYADYFANKWSAILRNKRKQNEDRLATYSFYSWIRESLHANKPYDQFVREVVASSGEAGKNPPVAWYREVKEQSAQVEDTAQLFLGLRIQCARCHHHPFEKWSQRDYYGFAAFFAQVGGKKSAYPSQQNAVQRIYHKRGIASANNPKNNEKVLPTGLGSPALTIPADVDPRQKLADWMAEKDNPFFAPALVNRYWKHFFGRGLVDPEDDMRVTNPASNPDLLKALAKSFVDSGFDLKKLVKTITMSSTYQLAADPNEWNKNDKQNFSRYYPKRLNAEVLLDAVNQVTGSTSSFGAGIPAGTRAVQLPDNAFDNYFLTVFGRPDASSACECERSSEANLAQSLHLLNSNDIQSKLTGGGSRAAKLAGETARSHDEKIRELYLVTFSREPAAEELAIAKAYIEKINDPKRAYEDIVWALINTKEFLFNH